MNEALEAENKALGAILPENVLQQILVYLTQEKSLFTPYETPLTPLDRRRLMGTGFKYSGFINAACAGATANPTLLPSYMTATKFKDNLDDFTRKQTLYVRSDQFAREVWDAMLTSGDVAYRDALDYYNSVKEATRHHIPGAETEYDRLKTFFKKTKRKDDDAPTEEEVERDVRALLHGTKEGRVVVENKLPSVEAAEQKVVDEVHSGHIAVKDTLEAEEKN